MQSPTLGSLPEDVRELPDASPARSTESNLLSLCAPYLYLTGAFAAFFATLYVTDWFWILPHSVLLAAAAVHLFSAFKRR